MNAKENTALSSTAYVLNRNFRHMFPDCKELKCTKPRILDHIKPYKFSISYYFIHFLKKYQHLRCSEINIWSWQLYFHVRSHFKVEISKANKDSFRPRSHVPVFDRPGANRTGENTTWNFVHTSRFSTGWQVSIIAGQSSGTQESIGVLTKPVRLAGRKNTGVCERVYKQYVLHCWLSYRPATGIIMDSSVCYPAAGRANDRVVWIRLCSPVFHYFVRQ
jgi:hypothetical protein